MENRVLCGASYYEQKFYLNPAYEVLPEAVKNELKIMCVLFVQDVSGIIMLEFNDDGNLQIMVTARDDDIYFDDIGAELKVKQIQQEKKELFGQLEEYYHAVSD
ncbi:MAG: hypothetical protein IKG00_02825 [Lachnospiraceae bacterium]|nr:hypothetical protein [Lachnospiraceae bacterium]MDO4529442.1 DUF6145 family protein [Lachnospiraceae bacterium]MDO4734971.1 DUF6145 family protein [Lachnospiraceae bacterium]